MRGADEEADYIRLPLSTLYEGTVHHVFQEIADPQLSSISQMPSDQLSLSITVVLAYGEGRIVWRVFLEPGAA